MQFLIDTVSNTMRHITEEQHNMGSKDKGSREKKKPKQTDKDKKKSPA